MFKFFTNARKQANTMPSENDVLLATLKLERDMLELALSGAKSENLQKMITDRGLWDMGAIRRAYVECLNRISVLED
jgi:hypothetical protein